MLHVLVDGGELMAAVLSEVPGPKARLQTPVAVLELTATAHNPVVIAGLGLHLYKAENKI